MKIGSTKSRVFDHLRASYALDYRSLAIFRILVALVVMADLVHRFGDARVMYSDEGILPRPSAIPILAADRWSLLFLQGSPEFARFFIAIGILAAALMLVGCRTRAATIVLWVVVVSLQARNSHLAYGADTLIRLALFWGMFLPLGAVWSFDRQNTSKPATNVIANLATFGLLVQNAYMYLFTALLKDGTHWRQDYDAVYLAVGMRDISTLLGEWIFINAPTHVFQLLTVGTLWMEFTVPVMLLLPLRADWLRMIAIALVFTLHLGIGTTMSVGLFPAISLASILVVLPSSFWVCVSNSRLAHGKLFARLRPMGMQPNTSSTPVGSTQHLLDPESQMLGFLPSYAPNTARMPHFALNLICVIAIVIGGMWNISAVSSFELPDPVRRAAVAAGLYQNWGMFAPNPRGVTRWFVVEGDTSSGQNVELITPIMVNDFSLRQQPEWDQSNEVQLRNERWRKYFYAIHNREGDGLKMAGYICRNWNAENSGDDRLNTVRFTVASATTLPNGERADPVYQQVGLWYCN